jgi:flagellin FlaB
MEKKYMERLVGKYCKIVTKEPGDKRASVVSGTLEDVDYKDGFILVNSEQGLGCLRISTIIAIKPGSKRNIFSENKNLFKKDEKGMMGIGTLIIFIAMVLVAAVAATVLIQTGQVLQQKAYKVGTETIEEVSSGVGIYDIVGYTNVYETHVDYMGFVITPRAGSGYLDLQNIVMTVKFDDLSVLKFDSNLVYTTITSGGVFNTANLSALTDLNYAIVVVHDADDSINETAGMNLGDTAYMIINTSALTNGVGLPPRSSISGKIIPENGAEAIYDKNMPCVFQNRIISLQ